MHPILYYALVLVLTTELFANDRRRLSSRLIPRDDLINLVNDTLWEYITRPYFRPNRLNRKRPLKRPHTESDRCTLSYWYCYTISIRLIKLCKFWRTLHEQEYDTGVRWMQAEGESLNGSVAIEICDGFCQNAEKTLKIIALKEVYMKIR